MSAECVCLELLNIPFSLMKEDKRPGIKGYRSAYCYSDIRILESSGENTKNGLQLLLSGKGCRNYEMFLEANEETWFDFFERILQYGCNVPRLDIAIDDFKTYFKISKLVKLAKKQQLVTKLRKGGQIGSFSLQNGMSMGDSLYLGRRSSGLMIRFYEKNWEQAERLGLSEKESLPKWNRYELELKQGKAVLTMKKLVEDKDIAKVALGILKSSVRIVRPFGKDKDRRRWPLWEPWEWFLQDVEELKLEINPIEKDFLDFYGWLLNSVAPSLWILDCVGKAKGYDFFKELVENATITEKHKRKLEDYLFQLETMEELKLKSDEKKEVNNN